MAASGTPSKVAAALPRAHATQGGPQPLVVKLQAESHSGLCPVDSRKWQLGRPRRSQLCIAVRAVHEGHRINQFGATSFSFVNGDGHVHGPEGRGREQGEGELGEQGGEGREDGREKKDGEEDDEENVEKKEADAQGAEASSAFTDPSNGGANQERSLGPSPGMLESAQSLVSSLVHQVGMLEDGLLAQEQEMDNSASFVSDIRRSSGESQMNKLRTAEEMANRMRLQLKAMERNVQEKDQALKRLLLRTQLSEKKVEEVERRSQMERQAMSKQLEQEKLRFRKELESVLKREEGLIQQLEQAKEGIAERDAFLKQLQEEAALSANALKQAAKAMVAARDRTLRIEEQLELLGDQLVKEQDNTAKERQRSAQLSADLAEARMNIDELGSRVKELELDSAEKDNALQATTNKLSLAEHNAFQSAQALAGAERRIRELEEALAQNRERMEAVDMSANVEEALAAKDQLVRESEHRRAQLERELDDLRTLLVSKDQILAAVKDETARNAELLMSAAKSRKELEDAQRQIQALEEQMRRLEEEVKSKESFLDDVRSDAINSADALKTAALIKQELNEAREREGHLQDELEAKQAEILELQQAIEDNVRTQQAEIELKNAQRRAIQLESERDALRAGIAKRDQALEMMKQELQRGAQMLSAAADTREALRTMKSQMDAMQADAQAKGQRLQSIEEELMSVGTTALPTFLTEAMRKRARAKAKQSSAEKPPQGTGPSERTGGGLH